MRRALGMLWCAGLCGAVTAAAALAEPRVSAVEDAIARGGHPVAAAFTPGLIARFDAGGEARPREDLRLVLTSISGGDHPELIFAQRVIDREWGPSEDSVYVEMEIPQWRSEGAAMGLSAALPGLGQAYAGNRRRGLWFALAEAVGWASRQIYRSRGDELAEEAVAFVGTPERSGSAWSFDRWTATNSDERNELERLYQADRQAFYDRIAEDPRYLSGWSGDPLETRRDFGGLLRVSNDRLRYARYASMALWINHVASAVDALHATRLHNVSLAPGLGLKLKGGWRSGGPQLRAAVERKF